MIRLELGVEDLADTRFGISPLTETVFSLWALTDPSCTRPTCRGSAASVAGSTRTMRGCCPRWWGAVARVRTFAAAPSRALPDFLTPRPEKFIARFEDELAAVRATAPEIVRRDLRATHAPDPPPDRLRAVARSNNRATLKLLGTICDALERHWERAIAPTWPQMQLVLEADTTYRARQLATGGARLLFADMHPNLRWDNGVLTIQEMISEGTIAAAGRGLLLVPSIFAYKPVPPLDPTEPPSVGYPSRGVATLWAPASAADAGALAELLGRPRARVLQMLAEPLPTLELARRLEVTPSAVSQHLKVLRATGLVTSARDRRHVLYRRSALGDQLIVE